MRFKDVIKRSAALTIMSASIIGLAACGSTDTAQDDNTESTSIVESEETTTLETEAEPEAETEAYEWDDDAGIVIWQ